MWFAVSNVHSRGSSLHPAYYRFAIGCNTIPYRMIQSIANLPLSRGNHGGRHQGRSNTSLSSRALFRCTILLPKSCEMYCLYCISSRTSASSSFALFWRAIAIQEQLHNFFDAAISDSSLHLVALICQVLYRGTGHWVGTTCIHFFQKFYYPITQPNLPTAPDTLHLSKCYQECIYIYIYLLVLQTNYRASI